MQYVVVSCLGTPSHEEVNLEYLKRCDRIDARSFTFKDMQRLHRPTIITNIFGESAPQWAQRWTRKSILRDYGDMTLPPEDLEFHGAGESYLLNLQDRGIDPFSVRITLRDVLNLKQPGNLFLPGFGLHPPAQNEIFERLHPKEGDLPDPLARLLGPMGQYKHASMGSKLQWNAMHQHKMTLFAQIVGSKGWVLSPGRSAEHANDFSAYTQNDVCGLFSDDVSHDNLSWHYDDLTLYLCKVHAGEAMFFPGLHDTCNVDPQLLESAKERALSACGWWHGTCNLKAWNAGFTYIGRSSCVLRIVNELNKFVKVFWLPAQTGSIEQEVATIAPRSPWETETLPGEVFFVRRKSGKLLQKIILSGEVGEVYHLNLDASHPRKEL